MSMVLLSATLLARSSIEVIKLVDTGDTIEVECLEKKHLGVNSAKIETNSSHINLKFSTRMSTVVYILIDTSKSMGISYRRGIKKELQRLIPSLEKNNIKVSLYKFSSNMKKVYATGDNNLSKVLGLIHIRGQNTELYRNAKNAIQLLSQRKERRKILLLISDGDAEDTPAYTANEIIQNANESFIRIGTLGYRDRGTKLQNLRKLAEETHGAFWKTNKKTYNMTSKFYDEIMEFINSKFVIYIPKKVLQSTLEDNQSLYLNINTKTKTQEVAISVPLQMLDLKSRLMVFLKKYKVIFLIASVFLILFLLWILLRHQKEEVPEEDKEDRGKNELSPLSEPVPVAYLESMGGMIHPIYQFPSTIGKDESNDIVIDGRFISRNHAIIDFKDGYFSITDRDSANKTKVNGQEVSSTMVIKPGDKIEFGPYKVTFILNEEITK